MRLLRRTALLAAVMAAPFAVSSAQAASNTVPLARTHSIVVDAANNEVFILGARDDASESSLFVMNVDHVQADDRGRDRSPPAWC